jgi:hypothetical protein
VWPNLKASQKGCSPAPFQPLYFRLRALRRHEENHPNLSAPAEGPGFRHPRGSRRGTVVANRSRWGHESNPPPIRRRKWGLLRGSPPRPAARQGSGSRPGRFREGKGVKGQFISRAVGLGELFPLAEGHSTRRHPAVELPLPRDPPPARSILFALSQGECLLGGRLTLGQCGVCLLPATSPGILRSRTRAIAYAGSCQRRRGQAAPRFEIEQGQRERRVGYATIVTGHSPITEVRVAICL